MILAFIKKKYLDLADLKFILKNICNPLSLFQIHLFEKKMYISSWKFIISFENMQKMLKESLNLEVPYQVEYLFIILRFNDAQTCILQLLKGHLFTTF